MTNLRNDHTKSSAVASTTETATDLQVEDISVADLETIETLLATYPGPVLILGNDAQARPINAAGSELAEGLNSPSGVALFPQLVQLAVKARTTGRAQTRIVAMPDGRRRMEVTLLPQKTGNILIVGRDATLETNIRSALAESRTRFKDLVDIVADFAWETDMTGRFSYISSTGALGYRPEELIGVEASDLLLDPASTPKPIPFGATEQTNNVDLWVLDRERHEKCLKVSSVPIVDDSGVQVGTRGIAIDTTLDRQRQSELARIKTRQRLVSYIINALRGEVTPIEMLEAAATALDRSTSGDACLVHIMEAGRDPYLAAMHGDPPDPDLAEKAIAALSSTEGVTSIEVEDMTVLGVVTRYRGRPNGVLTLWRPVSPTDWDDDEKALLAAVEPQFSVAFQQLLDQRALELLSRTDELTGLPNRRAFRDDLVRNLKRCARYGQQSALLFIDLDNFKPVNDTHGHDAGDIVLRRIAEIIEHSVRPYDISCRLGGDEFAVWLEGTDVEAAEMRSESIRRQISAINTDGTLTFRPDPPLSASIGVALHRPNSNEDADHLLRRADAVMYSAKHTGKNAVRVDIGEANDTHPSSESRRAGDGS